MEQFPVFIGHTSIGMTNVGHPIFFRHTIFGASSHMHFCESKLDTINLEG